MTLAALGQGGLGGLEEDLGLARPGEAVEVLQPGRLARYALESGGLLVREREGAIVDLELLDLDGAPPTAARLLAPRRGQHRRQGLAMAAEVHAREPARELDRALVEEGLLVQGARDALELVAAAGRRSRTRPRRSPSPRGGRRAPTTRLPRQALRALVVAVGERPEPGHVEEDLEEFGHRLAYALGESRSRNILRSSQAGRL